MKKVLILGVILSISRVSPGEELSTLFKVGLTNVIASQSKLNSTKINYKFNLESTHTDLKNSQQPPRIIKSTGLGELLGLDAKLFKIQVTETVSFGANSEMRKSKMSFDGSRLLQYLDTGSNQVVVINDNRAVVQADLLSATPVIALPQTASLAGSPLIDIVNFIGKPPSTWSAKSDLSGGMQLNVTTAQKDSVQGSEVSSIFKGSLFINNSGDFTGYNYRQEINAGNVIQVINEELKITDFQRVEIDGRSVKLPCEYTHSRLSERSYKIESKFKIQYELETGGVNGNYFRIDIPEGIRVEDKINDINYISGASSSLAK